MSSLSWLRSISEHTLISRIIRIIVLLVSNGQRVFSFTGSLYSYFVQSHNTVDVMYEVRYEYKQQLRMLWSYDMETLNACIIREDKTSPST